MSKQLLRSGTSIGANVEEALGSQSKKEFYSKISIAYKEARETKYWLELLFATKYISKQQFEPLFKEVEELLRLLGKTKITLEKNLKV